MMSHPKNTCQIYWHIKVENASTRPRNASKLIISVHAYTDYQSRTSQIMIHSFVLNDFPLVLIRYC